MGRDWGRRLRWCRGSVQVGVWVGVLVGVSVGGGFGFVRVGVSLGVFGLGLGAVLGIADVGGGAGV